MKFTIALCCTLAVLVAAASAAAVPKTYEGLRYLGGGIGALHDTSAYYVSFQRARWSVALEECEQMTNGEGSLVAIETREEDAALHKLILSSDVSKMGQNLWTSGAFDSVARVWRWASTGEPFDYTNWAGGVEPAFPSSTSRVAFRSLDNFNFNWIDRPNGEEENFFICEVPAYRNDTPVPCKRENDLVIVLDGSGSISAPDFVLGKEFSALLASAFNRPSRVAYIVFSSTSHVIFDLNNGLTMPQINETIRNVVQPAGGTATYLAIDDAVAMLERNPPGIPRKMVVLTDGQSGNAALTAQAAARATAAGVRSFSVGIGSGIRQEELLTIAGGDPSNVFTVANFDQLIQVIAPVCVRVCAQ